MADQAMRVFRKTVKTMDDMHFKVLEARYLITQASKIMTPAQLAKMDQGYKKWVEPDREMDEIDKAVAEAAEEFGKSH